MTALVWISYISVALLAIATAIVGGMGMYHGWLTIQGKSPGTIRDPNGAGDAPFVNGQIELMPGAAKDAQAGDNA